MDNYNKDIDDIRQLFKVKMLNNLWKYFNDSEKNSSEDSFDAKDIVNNEIDRVDTEYNDKYKKKKIGYNNSKANQFIDVITKVAFQKHWKNLEIIHKIIKITEYIENMDIDDILEKKKMLNKLIEMVKTRKLKNKSVDYDYNECKIINIDILSYDENKKIYKLK